MFEGFLNEMCLKVFGISFPSLYFFFLGVWGFGRYDG